AYWGLGLRGLPLIIVVLCAALPTGSNVLLFAGRYDVLQGETTSAIVASTIGFLVTGSLWLLLLTRLACWSGAQRRGRELGKSTVERNSGREAELGPCPFG